MHSETGVYPRPRMTPGPQSPLKQCRVMAGLTQQMVADRAGLARRTVMRIEQGKQRPSLETAASIAAALGLELDAARVLFPDPDAPELGK